MKFPTIIAISHQISKLSETGVQFSNLTRQSTLYVASEILQNPKTNAILLVIEMLKGVVFFSQLHDPGNIRLYTVL